MTQTAHDEKPFPEEEMINSSQKAAPVNVDLSQFSLGADTHDFRAPLNPKKPYCPPHPLEIARMDNKTTRLAKGR